MRAELPGMTSASIGTRACRSRRGMDLLHTGSFSATLPPGHRVIRDLVCRAARQSAMISYDSNIGPDLIGDEHRTRQAVMALVARSDLVKVSDEDLAWMIPGRDRERAAQMLLPTTSRPS
jgi:fructokinase